MKSRSTLLFFLILSICACKKESAPKTDNTTTTQITSPGKYLLFDAFESYNLGQSDTTSLFTSLYRTNLDGSGLLRITTAPTNYFDYRASYSVDGSKIVFVRKNASETDRGIYTVDSIGNNLTTIIKGNVDYASFSPDGKRVAYVKSLTAYDTGLFNLYVINADGTNEQEITSYAYVEGGAFNVYWSPNGKIYFAVSDPDKMLGTYSINADGSDLKLITTGNIGVLSISADGSHLLCQTNTGMMICNSDGTDIKTLVNFTSKTLEGACWSEDGKQIYYSNFDVPSSAFGIFKINIDGSGLTKVLNGFYEYPSIH